MLRRLAVVVALIASGIAIASCGGESAAYENGYRVATAISNQGGGNFGTPNAAAECQFSSRLVRNQRGPFRTQANGFLDVRPR